MNAVSYGLVLQELERGDSGLRSLCSVQGSLVMYPILKYGDEAQRKKWLPELARGKLIGCFGLTEPSSGSDPSSMRTVAKKDGGHYVLNGIKTWITSSPVSHLAVVWAKVQDENERIRGFVVERGTKGFETPTIEGKFSLRASPTGEIHLTDCRVPEQNLLPDSGGLRSPLGCLTQARHGIAWGSTGAALDCFDTVLKYGLDRVQFGKPIASFQLYQAQLAEMATQIIASQLMSLHFGRLKDDGNLSAEQSACTSGTTSRWPATSRTRRAPCSGHRHHGCVSGHPAPDEPRERLHLRRHARDSHARHRAGPHRHQRLRMTSLAVTPLPRGERLARAVQRLGRALARLEREMAVLHRVTVAQLRTLVVLSEGASTVTVLAQTECVAVSTMTRNLVVLERLGFVSRQDGAVDRRTVLADLTGAGQVLAQAIAKSTATRLSGAFAGFHATEQVERAAAVDRVAASLERET